MIPHTAKGVATEGLTAAAAGGSSAIAGNSGQQFGEATGLNPQVTRAIFEAADAITVGSLQTLVRGGVNIAKMGAKAI